MPATPLQSGQTITIYCTGLGAIDQPLNPATGATSSPVTTVNTVTVSIGGQNAPVTFAGLASGYPGVYEVTATVPAGVSPGSNVPVTVTVADKASSAVQVSVQ